MNKKQNSPSKLSKKKKKVLMFWANPKQKKIKNSKKLLPQ
jgi:hypothetical protein